MASSLPWTTVATLATTASKLSEKVWTARAATRDLDMAGKSSGYRRWPGDWHRAGGRSGP